MDVDNYILPWNELDRTDLELLINTMFVGQVDMSHIIMEMHDGEYNHPGPVYGETREEKLLAFKIASDIDAELHRITDGVYRLIRINRAVKEGDN